MAVVCKNCNTTFEGNYCNNCGQAASTGSINKNFLLHDVILGFFSFDKGISFTIKELFTRPGYAIKDFLAGKRIRYAKPVSFILLVTGIYVFICLYFNIDITNLAAYEQQNDQVSVVSYQMLTWVKNNMTVVSLFLLPLFALGSFLAFRKQGYNYMEHIVINIYWSALLTMVSILTLPIILLIPREHQWALSSSLHTTLFIAFGFWICYQIFSDLKPAKRIRKIILIFVYYLLLLFLFSTLYAVIIFILN